MLVKYGFTGLVAANLPCMVKVDDADDGRETRLVGHDFCDD